ncbi:radical SAM protein [Phosphitispora sp. TUW77]|uniref:radical SAM protein n=1 Tax=Phosphitispora sp. TUW77 TaxID=3152361 RepID=UPI003AB820BA
MKGKILLVLWTTSECNLRCKYCYASAVQEKQKMGFETACKALDMVRNSPIKVQFAGGEPMLNFQLIERVYDYIRRKGYNASLQMQTNGTLINSERARALKKMKIALGVSLDGTADVNERLRGGTKLAVEGIRELARRGMMVNINSVVTAQNVEKLPGLLDFALYLGNVGGIGLDLLRIAGSAKEDQSGVSQPSAEQLRTALKSMHQRSMDIYKQFGRRIVIREVEEAKKRLFAGQTPGSYCYASCGRSIVVLPDGNIYPCGSLIGRQDYYMGRVDDGKYTPVSLKGIKPGRCDECKYGNICPGGCPSRMIVNYDEEPQLNSLDCVLKKTAFEIAEKCIYSMNGGNQCAEPGSDIDKQRTFFNHQGSNQDIGGRASGTV